MDKASKTSLLDLVKSPEDLRRKLAASDLPQLAAELRQETIDAVSVTGGHLGAGLGVVELTVALHWVFDTPRDRLVWDVGHQTYPHKIITGRRDRIRTLRQPGGLSGFTKRTESEYDPFGAAHSSTSISAGLGMAVARDLAGSDNNVVCVIGDGAMSAGMAYEALNNAGARDERLIVILNDNDMSIAPPTGAMSAYLARITSSGTYFYLRDIAKQLARKYWWPVGNDVVVLVLVKLVVLPLVSHVLPQRAVLRLLLHRGFRWFETLLAGSSRRDNLLACQCQAGLLGRLPSDTFPVHRVVFRRLNLQPRHSPVFQPLSFRLAG